MTEREGPGPLLRTALAAGGRARIRAQGTSMLPAIGPGTTLTVTAHPFDEVRPGQVIAYALGNRIIVHRVAVRTRSAVIALGDNLPLFDPPVGPQQYLGLVSGHEGPVPSRRPDVTGLARSGPPRVRVLVPGPALFREAAVKGFEVLRAPWPPVPGELMIGISPYGALPGSALGEILAAAQGRPVGILVGHTFGSPADVASPDPVVPALPVEAAHFHVRLGEPLQPLGTTQTLAAVADLTGAPLSGARS
ncbi:S24/S26 family peptidase [Streptomyces sp. NPDC047108]|uniref:S24/S26 family peptidase n=1 Tax=Streptomyces sp. NPDC047108 TaxID=3155025 RepID=UPI0033E59F5F